MGETYTVGGGRSDYRLPTVSSADNGKILKVVEGEWNKAENSGGGGGGGGESLFFAIDVVSDDTTETGYGLADETKIAEYITNISNGKIPVVRYNYDGRDYICTSVDISDESEEGYTVYAIAAHHISISNRGVAGNGYTVALVHSESGDEAVVTKYHETYPGVS